jgi:hypothetical protein
MEKLSVSTFRDLVGISKDALASIIGDINAYKFKERIDSLFANPIYDYIIVGALGFSSIAQETWKKIFNVITLNEFLSTPGVELYKKMLDIKGIGLATINIIEAELPYFMDDLAMISKIPNIVSSKGLVQKKIRCTGFRDEELMKQLRSMGYDADDNKGVTKDTYILLVPGKGHVSTKTKAAGPSTKIISVAEFRENMSLYL